MWEEQLVDPPSDYIRPVNVPFITFSIVLATKYRVYPEASY